ncbi:hypothetical protein HXZ66_19625 [Bacillus sp. A116_S68]|nr:hypothetical protein HXZ66_19625 [Bacillus sp. A116_S68]
MKRSKGYFGNGWHRGRGGLNEMSKKKLIVALILLVLLTSGYIVNSKSQLEDSEEIEMEVRSLNQSLYEFPHIEIIDNHAIALYRWGDTREMKLGVAELKKNWLGEWTFTHSYNMAWESQFEVVELDDLIVVTGYMKDDEVYRIQVKTMMGNEEAELIEHDYGYKLWFFVMDSTENYNEANVKYVDKKGNVLEEVAVGGD